MFDETSPEKVNELDVLDQTWRTPTQIARIIHKVHSPSFSVVDPLAVELARLAAAETIEVTIVYDHRSTAATKQGPAYRAKA